MQPPAGMPSGPPSRGERTPWWEDAVCILAILSLWPFVLRWPGAFWRWLAGFMLALMVLIFVRRMNRLKHLQKAQQEQAENSRFPNFPGMVD